MKLSVDGQPSRPFSIEVGRMAKQAADRDKEERGMCPRCDLSFTRTETPADNGMIEVRERCASCGRGITRWRKRDGQT